MCPHSAPSRRDVSNSKQRKARQQARREQWERDQLRLAGRRRRYLLVGLSAAALVIALVVAAAFLSLRGVPPQTAERSGAASTELIPEEAAREAQAGAVNEAIAAGDVIAEDYTVPPGTPVSSGQKPPPDDRPVACAAKVPPNAGATRPRYPGGPEKVLRDGVDYLARVDTSCGPIVIDLMEDHAPVAVNSFVFLAREGFYDGLVFFRDFGGITAAQAGSGNNAVGWDIGYRLPDELDLAEQRGYPIGTVTTTSEGPYTAGSDFYIAYGEAFDAGFATQRTQTVLGQVRSGMDVINTLTALDRLGMGGEDYAERLFIESVTIEERRPQ
jgi:cyclophilin family peptidyl-prolyl cis-trans isomerase